MLESLIVDKRVRIDDVLICDRNALILSARIGGYGPDYEAQVICPSCSEKSKHKFDLRNIKKRQKEDVNETGDPEDQEPFNPDTATYSLILPRTGFSVEIRALNGHDEKILNGVAESKGQQQTLATTQIRLFIHSINGKTDKNEVAKIVETLPASDARYLRNRYRELFPDFDMKQHFVCQNTECSFEGDVEMTLDARISLASILSIWKVSIKISS